MVEYAEASAPGKIILVGEHAVVYGAPAIALPVSTVRVTVSVTPAVGGSGITFRSDAGGQTRPLDLSEDSRDPIAQMVRSTLSCAGVSGVDFSLQLNSQIPVASGMGSGAAVSTAIGRAVSRALRFQLSDEQLNQLVYEVEKLHHGTPSGIDNTVIVYEKPIFFQREHPIRSFLVSAPFVFLIADTGISAPTKAVVDDVRILCQRYPSFVGCLIDEIAHIVGAAHDALALGQEDRLGALMLSNHALLQTLGVSSLELDVLVSAAVSAGALGAKLSGGGRGGNMISLVHREDVDVVTAALLTSGAVRVTSLLL